MRCTSILDMAMGLLVTIAFLSTVGHAFKPIPQCRGAKARKLPEQQTQQPGKQQRILQPEEQTQQPAKPFSNDCEDGGWHVTTNDDWNNNPQPGLRIKAFCKMHMTFNEASMLCMSNDALLASIGGLHSHRIHALFPFRAWVRGENGPCEFIDVDGYVRSSNECDTRADYAICQRPAE
ncbi:hypothetical protein Q1695_014245 [Nippostrongylus brasiliensis]|nr:hypothetical protein Q1695_014245 [Nippostrongylus brasiliensis]